MSTPLSGDEMVLWSPLEFQLVAERFDLDNPETEYALQTLANFQEMCEELEASCSL
jgi:hypothetical protein